MLALIWQSLVNFQIGPFQRYQHPSAPSAVLSPPPGSPLRRGNITTNSQDLTNGPGWPEPNSVHSLIRCCVSPGPHNTLIAIWQAQPESQSEANLSRANLEQAQLNHADLAGADLSGANLTWAKMDDTNLTGANLAGATLDLTKMDSADLSGAIMPDGAMHE